MEQDQERINNQKEFRAILEQLGITQAQAAELITKKTLRKVSTRAVKSWLSAPTAKTAKTARTCPAWAIKVLNPNKIRQAGVRFGDNIGLAEDYEFTINLILRGVLTGTTYDWMFSCKEKMGLQKEVAKILGRQNLQRRYLS